VNYSIAATKVTRFQFDDTSRYAAYMTSLVIYLFVSYSVWGAA